MKHGFTLAELALAMVIAGLLLGIALPRFAAVKQEVAVEHAAQSLVSAHRRARMIAIARGYPAVLSVAARTLRITLVGAGQPHWSSPGPAEEGVALAGPPGLSNASFHLSLGSASRTVVVSRLGRVRISRTP